MQNRNILNLSNFLKTFILLLFLSNFISCEEDPEFCEEPEPCICPVDSTEEIFRIDLSEVDIVRVYQQASQIYVEIDDEEVSLIDSLGIIWSKQEEVVFENQETDFIITENIPEDYIGWITNLEEGSEYNFRAFAYSQDSLFYSEIQSIKTIRKDGTIDSIQDVDSNSYRTKIIGGNEWMIENLKTLHFNDGSEIPGNFDDQSWGNLTSAGLGIYDHKKIDGFESDSAILETYGALYNWYCIEDDRGLCPEGWHVSSDEEWRELEVFLGMNGSASLDTDYRGSDQGAQLKIRATYPFPQPRWDEGNVSSNSTGFSVIPGGARYDNGNYGYKGFFGYIWTATNVASDDAWGRTLVFSQSKIGRDIIDKNMGMNIRCIKNDH